MTLSQREQIKRITLDDIVASFGWQDRPFGARLLRWIFSTPARLFAREMERFDSQVGTRGLGQAARSVLVRYFDDIRVFGAGNIPDSGFLALSNHPGASDTLATFAALDRPDLKIIAQHRAFFEGVPNVAKQLFFVTEDTASRVTLVRQVSAFLRKGGPVLTYPAGQIEPDPDLHADAVDSLHSWTESVGVFIRMSPQTPILPILVRGVVWDKAVNFPLVRIKRTREDRERLASALQLFAHMVWKTKSVRVRVQIGMPIFAADIGSMDTQAIHRSVLREMKRLIENPPTGDGISAFR